MILVVGPAKDSSSASSVGWVSKSWEEWHRLPQCCHWNLHIKRYTAHRGLEVTGLRFRRLRVRFPGWTATSTLSDRAKAAAWSSGEGTGFQLRRFRVRTPVGLQHSARVLRLRWWSQCLVLWKRGRPRFCVRQTCASQRSRCTFSTCWLTSLRGKMGKIASHGL